MSKLSSAFGKPLKGISSSGTSNSNDIADIVVNAISSGAVTMNNVDISGGVINNVIFGNDGGGPIFATTLTTGTSNGVGYDVIFYGDTLGEYAWWHPEIGLWEISGDMYVSGVTDLGNIRIAGNTISSTTGNIIIDPSGDECLIINGCVTQNSNIGDVSFNVVNGLFTASSTNNLSLTSTTGEVNIVSSQEASLVSNNGDIFIGSGASKTVYGITNISTGTSPTITTSTLHNLEVGDEVKFISTDSTPNINGSYTVTQVLNGTSFRITPGFDITSIGNTGSFTKNTDIYLNSSNSINIPYDVKLTFGSDTNYIMDTFSPLNELNIVSGSDINFSPALNGDINIQNDIGLTFGSDLRKIESDGTNLIVTSDNNINLTPSVSVTLPYSIPLRFGSSVESISGTAGVINVSVPQTNVSGNFTVNGVTTNLNSTTVNIVDPIITLGTVANDSKDRGIEYLYFNTTSKLGYFGMDTTDKTFMYIPDAVNTGEVISGALGNVKFADGSFTSLNLNNGVISKVNTISSDVDLTISPGTTRNLIIDMDSGTDITIPEMVDLNFNASGTNKIYSDGTNLHLVNGAVVDGDTVINGSLTVTGAVTFTGGTSLIYTVERISGIGGSSISPNINFNTTFVSVTSTGTASGTLPAHNTDGFVKNISIVSLVGNPALYELNFPAGRLLDPGTGTTSAKKMIFNCPGQGVQLLWDNVLSLYVIINSGGELLPA